MVERLYLAAKRAEPARISAGFGKLQAKRHAFAASQRILPRLLAKARRRQYDGRTALCRAWLALLRRRHDAIAEPRRHPGARCLWSQSRADRPHLDKRQHIWRYSAGHKHGSDFKSQQSFRHWGEY